MRPRPTDEKKSDFIYVSVEQAWNWAKTPMMVAVVDERGNATGQVKSKPDLPGNMTCRLRVMLHCIKHPHDEVAFKALCEPDKVELLELRKLNPTKKSRRRKK